MSEELEEELDYGKELARLLVRHMDAMGAGGCTIPIILRDETYEVTVKRRPITTIEPADQSDAHCRSRATSGYPIRLEPIMDSCIHGIAHDYACPICDKPEKP